MSFTEIVKGAVLKVRARLRAPPRDDKIPGDRYGFLPLHPARFAICREAFESGLEMVSLSDALCRKVAGSPEIVWWSGLAQLTPDERLAVYRRVQEFAKAKLDKMK